MNTSITRRLAAAAASVVTTLALFAGVLSLAADPGPANAIQVARAAAPTAR